MISSNTILSLDRLEEVVDRFSRNDAFAYDYETYGPDRGQPAYAPVSWLSLASYGESYAIPMGHPIGTKVVGERREPRADKNGKIRRFRVPIYEDPPEQLTPAQVFNTIKPLFQDENILKVTHGGLFDVVAEAKYLGGLQPGPYADTIVEDWTLNENRKAYGLKIRTKEDYGIDYDQENVGKCVEKFPFNKVAYYAFMDARMTWLRHRRLYPQIEEQGLSEIFNLEMELFKVLAKMRLHGARVDEQRLKELHPELTDELEEIETRLYRAAGRKFNINSSKQKQELFFLPKSEGGLGLKPWKLTKGGMTKQKNGEKIDPVRDYSTDADVLESFPNNPVASTLLEYQEVNKILGTYVEGYLGNEEKGKPCLIYNEHIHADFVQYGTVTGRFSCREPNLQNIPRPDTDLGKKVRGMFIAEDGGKLIVADYGQIELVILAHYLGQGKLFEGFAQGIDPHTATAAGVLVKNPADVTSEERQLFGKTLNFATNYGVGVTKVANMLKVSQKEAKQILAAHRREFPEIYAFKSWVIDTARKRRPVPYVKTLLGRKRRLPELNYADDGLRNYAERQAFNSLIQGGNADIIKTAMVRADRMLPEDVRLILTVHDEIVLSAPDDRVDEGVEILREAMLGEGIQSLLKVKMSADIKVVNRWSEAK